jgi:hypothetical protein
VGKNRRRRKGHELVDVGTAFRILRGCYSRSCEGWGAQDRFELGDSHHFSIMAGQAGDAENQEGGDRAEPADREGDMSGDGQLPKGGCHRWTPISDSLLGTVAGWCSPVHASPAQVGDCFSAQQGRMTVYKVRGASQELGDSGELVGIEILQQGGYVFA